MANPILNLSTLNGSNGFRINGVAANDNSGYSVSGAGDINGDGIDDVIVGAFGADSNDFDAGSSYIVFGSRTGFAADLNLSTLNGSNGFRIDGRDLSNKSGYSVSGAGDVNGDGIDDLIIGIPGDNEPGMPSAGRPGSSYVVFGNRNGFSSILNLSILSISDGFSMRGIHTDDFVGRSVSGAGDVNDDGIDDLIIGAPGARPYGSLNDSIKPGQSYVVFGSRSGFSSPYLVFLDGSDGFVIDGNGIDDKLGVSVSSAGDVNGDGIDDVIVGAPEGRGNGNFAGASYVVFGNRSGFAANFNVSTLNGSNGFRINGITQGDRLGASVRGAGDVNGDGIDDLIVGAPLADPSGSGSGQSYVIFGRRSGFTADFIPSALNGSNGFRLNGSAIDDFSGFSVSGAGDVNGDGVDDLIVGAYGSAGYAGQSYVVFGSRSGFAADFNLATVNGSNGFRIDGIAIGDFSGLSVSGAGDVNGDGVDDLIIGACFADSNAGQSGQSYVVFGAASDIAGLTLTPPTVNASGVTLGSVNADLNTGVLTLNFTPRAITRSIAGYTNVLGTAFDDSLIGNGAANTLIGNGGNDAITGNDGDDLLAGGVGNDSLTGGIGRDRFLFSLGAQFNRTQIGIDAITDFTVGQDKLVLDRATFKGVKKIKFATVKKLAQAQKSTAQLTYIRKTGALFFNANGDKNGFGTGGQFADLANGLNLTAKDIVLGTA